MKIKCYPAHNRCIATGYENGRRVKVQAVCSKDDQFDKDFGVQLAALKYKVAKKDARIADHERDIKDLQNLIKACELEIANQKKAIEIVKAHKAEAEQKVTEFLSTKYSTQG